MNVPIRDARTIRSAATKGQFIVETRTGEVFLLDAVTVKVSKINPNAIVDVDVVPQIKQTPLDQSSGKGMYGGAQFMIETDMNRSPIVRITQIDGTIRKVELWKLFQ